MIFLVKKQLQFSTPNTKENKTMASPRVVEFLLFWLPAIHHITFEHHVVISNDVRCFLDGIFKGEHWNFQTTFWREHHPRVCVHDATTPAGNDDIIKIADDQEDEDSTRRRPRIEWNYSRKTTVRFGIFRQIEEDGGSSSDELKILASRRRCKRHTWLWQLNYYKGTAFNFPAKTRLFRKFRQIKLGGQNFDRIFCGIYVWP